MTTGDAPLVAAAVPQLAARLEEGLRAAGEPELAAAVPALRVTIVCPCEHDFCGSFHTARTPLRRWFRRGREVELEPDGQRRVTVTVAGGEIVYVEVLFWPEVRAALAPYRER